MAAKPYRVMKRPIEVQAMPWRGPIKEANEIIAWVIGNEGFAYFKCIQPDSCWGPDEHGDAPHLIMIRTLEGEMPVRPNWWVIRGIHGEFYPCKGDIFEESYQLLDMAGPTNATH